MLVSLKWLRSYIDVSLSPKELADRLTMAGMEVGGIRTIGGGWDNVVVGQVVALDKHPNADRLKLATIDLAAERITVVCGAPNLRVGDKVPFARVGARLIDPESGKLVDLKPAKIRGVSSSGMACSEKELGISESHEGIMILPPEAPLGMPLAEYLGDAILDIKVTPNRPDCLSVIGVAREVAALTAQRLRLPQADYEEAGPPIAQLMSVAIVDPELCSRYCASLITDVKVGPSPLWMQQSLVASGMRPINNIVDITNFVMLEYGQPLHAFDYQEIKDRKIIVRRARDGETLITLDGVERQLSSDMLVIADSQEAVCLAGVMGGAASEVTLSTSAILLESANFNPASIRHTSTRLRLPSEASLRFNKGLSPELTLPALRRATQLLVELAGGRAARGIIDTYPGKREREPILLSTERVSRVLGVELGTDQIRGVLDSLGFDCKPLGQSDLSVTAPHWRTDIDIAEDLIEEVARITGYDEIPTTILRGQPPAKPPSSLLSLKESSRDILTACGMQEVITYSLTSRALLDKIDPERKLGRPLRLANPLTLEQEYLRTTLRAGLLATFSANEKHEEDSIRLFELGKVYLPQENDLPEEREMLAAILGGPRLDRCWFPDEGQLDLFDAKGILESLCRQLRLEAGFEVATDQILIPGRTARVTIGGAQVGVIGELHPTVATSFDITTKPVSFFEIDVEKLLPLTTRVHQFRPIPRFPRVVQDIALIVDASLPAKRVQDFIRGFPLVDEVAIFDVYSGEQVPGGKKSLAFSICYQSPTRTLTAAEVQKAQQGIITGLRKKFGAAIRE